VFLKNTPELSILFDQLYGNKTILVLETSLAEQIFSNNKIENDISMELLLNFASFEPIQYSLHNKKYCVIKPRIFITYGKNYTFIKHIYSEDTKTLIKEEDSLYFTSPILSLNTKEEAYEIPKIVLKNYIVNHNNIEFSNLLGIKKIHRTIVPFYHVHFSRTPTFRKDDSKKLSLNEYKKHQNNETIAEYYAVEIQNQYVNKSRQKANIKKEIKKLKEI
jgi:hypothetical protein